MCDCLELTIEYDTFGEQVSESQAIGVYNGKNYYEYVYAGANIVIWYNGGRWFCTKILGDLSIIYTIFQSTTDCPEAVLGTSSGTDWIDAGVWTNLVTFTTKKCPEPNCWNEDRTERSFNSIKLPTDFVEQERGIKECCCKYLVLADSTSSDSFKNDVTSAWLKISDPSDTYAFKLYKNNQVTTFAPVAIQFPFDSLAYYTTINWKDVLAAEGVGCYELKIEYSISGITSSVSWGIYDLKEYTVQNALNTARIKAKFNGYQEVQGINFTGSDVVSTLRFYGFIGNRQPNMETDNIMYSNREMKRVIRENLNTYEIITDPADECITKPLIELYLLSENELFISDYNAHNHSYRYEDISVIVDESPDITYYDFSRKAQVNCVVTDKFKNKRTYYK
jgi:hypothetical protein